MIVMKNSIIGLILINIFVLLSGCNTVKGLGQDLQQGGQEIQKAATNNQSSHH